MSKYRKENDQKWNETNRDRRNYLSKRTTARHFIKRHANLEDIRELSDLASERLTYLVEEENM